jgi:hypothetical protein
MIGVAPNEEAASVGGLNQELSRTLKILLAAGHRPNWIAGQLEVAGKGPPAILNP